MNLASLAVAGLLTLLLVASMAAVVFSIARNYHHGLGFRARLAQRLEGLRLERMLALRGIDKQRYLHRIPVVEIEQQLRNCGGCQAEPRCDQALADPGRARDLRFCPNDGRIQTAGGAEVLRS